MAIWIGLFRGINVGGNNLLPMKSLPAIIESCGGSDAKTYIQSGNVVFNSAAKDGAALAKKIGAAVMAAHGFEPRLVMLNVAQLAAAMSGNPFAQAEAEPATVHLFFLAGSPAADPTEKLNAVKAASESWWLDGEVLYLHTPDGVGNSKLADRIPKILGVDVTARNWRSVGKILELARSLQ